jgi:MFS family permease
VLLVMSAQNTINWIRIGLFALPLSGVLLAWSSLDPQPDQTKDPEAWARFVGSNYYLITHVFGSIGSSLFAILGVVALGAYLSNSRAGRLGLVAMVITVVAQALSLVIGGVSTFALNAIGRAYLSGTKDVMKLEFSSAMSVLFGLAILLLVVGNVLLGVSVWRSGTLPRWAGAIWVASALLLFYVLGAVLGMATTGSSLLTQPVGGLLMVIGGGWIALSTLADRPPRERPQGRDRGCNSQPLVLRGELLRAPCRRTSENPPSRHLGE